MKRLAGVLAVCASCWIAAPVGAATPTVKAAPKQKLTNDEFVTVTWRGFRPGTPHFSYIYFAQCARTVGLLTESCDTNYAVSAGATRSGTIQMRVATGTIDSSGDTCGTSADDADGCMILAFEGHRGSFNRPRPGQNASFPISFAVTP